MPNVNRSYFQKCIKLLYGFAAGRCSNPACREEVILPETPQDRRANIGKIAHMVAHSSDGPRGDPNFDPSLRDEYENLILLCGVCHDTIDNQDSTYSIAKLQGWKREHEEWVRCRLTQEASTISFAELEVVCKALVVPSSDMTEDFALLPPLEKMRKNHLTEQSQGVLKLGLSRAREVEVYLSGITAIDRTFPDRLISGFRSEYNELVAEGLKGDELFMQMWEFAGNGSHDMKMRMAGLIVLAALFEKCEVFEK